MIAPFKIIPFLFILLFPQGFYNRKTDFSKGKHNNVCKDLKDNVLVYVIFVDSRETAPWTEFDIRTTLDSLNVAVRWLTKQAKQNNIQLNLITDYYIGPEYTPVKRALPYETVQQSVTQGRFRKGIDLLNDWADYIAKRAGSTMNIEQKDGIREILTPKNVERLVAFLRDEKQVESVALLFMLNNYYRNDISIPVNHLDDKDIEFAIISYKYPAVIAQNILNLFGAADLYETVYRKNEKKIKAAKEFFPNDIMQDIYAGRIDQLSVGNLTKFLIGWENQLDDHYRILLTD
ncbi:MAG: hypothetical protein JXR41_03950 [Bacteroidales bacterium]|nr:hypothetical protein [Bacteroidales bacterium]MBN2762221.1 hypothetical protein [Bacteroidales bacterium]